MKVLGADSSTSMLWRRGRVRAERGARRARTRTLGSSSEDEGGLEVRIEMVCHAYKSGDGALVPALQDVDLVAKSGEFVCILGPSGCGKSTLLHIVAGFVRPTSGNVVVGGELVSGPDARRGIVLQQPNLFPWLSVWDNVCLGPRMRGVPRTVYSAGVDGLLRGVGLGDFRGRKPYELSGGMQQRAAIARVLANGSNVWLMDEPFGALDAITRERLQIELRSLWQREQRTVLFVTHSVEEAIFLGTRVVVMGARPGRIIGERNVVENEDREGAAFGMVRKELRELIFDSMREEE